MRAAIVRAGDSRVINVIEYEPEGNYQPPADHVLAVADIPVSPGDWYFDEVFVPRELAVGATPQPAVTDQTVTVTVSLPPSSPDSEVTFRVTGGQTYAEPVTDGQASHDYAFARPGTYIVQVASDHHVGQVEVHVA